MKGNLEQGKIRIRIPSAARLMMGLLEYLWVIFVILNGNSIYHANSIRNLYLLEIVLLLTFLLLMMNMLLYRTHPAKTSMLGAVMIMGYSAVYFCVMQDKMSAKNFLELFVLGAPVAFLLFAELYRQGRLFKLMYRFGDILFLLAIVSLFFWFMGEVFRIIRPNGYVNISWGGFDQVRGYYGIHYAFQLDTTFFPDAFLYRNSSIFSEAPMFNLWLDIVLAIELFLKPKASKLRVVIYVVTILTTLSVTGILFLVLCVALSALSNLRHLNKAQTCLLILLGLVVIPLMVTLVIKSVSMKADTVSYEMRLSDYVGGVRLWMDHPLFGSGYANLGTLLPYIFSPTGGLGFSNSVTAVLGTGGIWMALLFYIAHIGMVFPRLTGSRKVACFGVCYLYLFCTTAFFGRFISAIMVSFGYAIISGAKNKDYLPD